MGGKIREMVGLLLLALSVQPMLAKGNWPLTVKVMSTKNIEDPHGSFHLSWFSSGAGSGSSTHAGWSHRIAEHAFVEASDGNSYELQPKNQKDMLLPGTYQAKIEKRDLMVCEPKDNGNCHLSRTDCWRWSGIAVYVYENCRPANSTNSHCLARPRGITVSATHAGVELPVGSSVVDIRRD